MSGMFLKDINDWELCVPSLPQLQVVDHLHDCAHNRQLLFTGACVYKMEVARLVRICIALSAETCHRGDNIRHVISGVSPTACIYVHKVY